MTHAQTYLINGSFNLHISPFDRGFAYGDGVFRTIKMQNGLPENWPAHYQKLVADCATIDIVCPSAELLMGDIAQLFAEEMANENAQANISAVAKIIITRGEGSRGYTPPAITNPTRVLLKSPMPNYPARNFTDGVALMVCQTRFAAQPKLAGVKTLNRLENVLARMEMTKTSPELAEGIMLDAEGKVIECTAANIFARFGDTLSTPDLSNCGIAGITRQRILAVAHTLNLKPNIETFSLEKLAAADEIIICSSLYGAWQVNSIQNQGKTQLIKVGTLAANIRAALRAV